MKQLFFMSLDDSTINQVQQQDTKIPLHFRIAQQQLKQQLEKQRKQFKIKQKQFQQELQSKKQLEYQLRDQILKLKNSLQKKNLNIVYLSTHAIQFSKKMILEMIHQQTPPDPLKNNKKQQNIQRQKQIQSNYQQIVDKCSKLQQQIKQLKKKPKAIQKTSQLKYESMKQLYISQIQNLQSKLDNAHSNLQQVLPKILQNNPKNQIQPLLKKIIQTLQYQNKKS